MLFRTLIALACLAFTTAMADDELFSAFTAAQLKEMARSTIKTPLAAGTGEQAVTAPDVSTIDMMRTAQLRGYAAGMLERGKPGSLLDICGKRHGLPLITHRLAISLEETVDTDVSGTLIALIALTNACNDTLWAN